MRRLTRSAVQAINTLPRPHRLLLATLLVITLMVSFWRPQPALQLSPSAPFTSQQSSQQDDPADRSPALLPPASEPLDPPALADLPPDDELDDKTPSGSQYYTVSAGDTLTSILGQYDIDLADISRLSNADSQLRKLNIGQQLHWQQNAEGQLQQLHWQISRKETRHYQRNGDIFTMRTEIRNGEWRNRLLSGTLTDSFINSAKQSGLSHSEINTVVNALQWQIDFRKLQKGDQFVVLLASETLDGQHQQSQLIGARLRSGGKDYYAIRAENGKYYDRNGSGLAKGFLRFPTARQYRVSSGFNLRRLHPITGQIVPHKGVDFAMPSGTPILAVGDGEIIETKYTPTAGHYITIRHGRTYTTRYLHLQKILVRSGQKIKRGDRIALSGNTGRSTGAHLHYELWINQQPVNPLTAKLPLTESLTGNERRHYLAQVTKVTKALKFD